MPEKTISTKPKPFIFVLMPFEVKFDDIYKFGIKGAAEDAGAYAQRVDEQIFVEGMLDRIFNQINKADVIVADMTGKNPNVFYEVGYAHALDKVVLLITQSADDIPFDLKHRQHTVYGGSIETLRAELASRISWAVTEAERRGTDADAERMSARLAGWQLPVGLGASPVPQIKGQIKAGQNAAMFGLPLLIRNDSERGILEVSHVYLFSSEDAQIVPIEMPNTWLATSSNATPQFSAFTNQPTFLAGPSELESFTADPVDAPDGLTKQFRVPALFGKMPPRTMESINLNFELKGAECDSTFRLRCHTATHYFDFSFRLVISRAAAESSSQLS